MQADNSSFDVEAVEESLRQIEQHPIDLNHASTAELSQLFWLTPEQVDNILLYSYEREFHSVYELKLVHGLTASDIDMLLPFVCVQPKEKKDTRTVRDLFRYASHELTLRLDARKLTTYEDDPVYGAVKYRLNAANKLKLGLTFKRDAGEIPSAYSRYGLYAELRDMGALSTLVAGDYRASFGLGLVVNSALPLGKSTYSTLLGTTQSGLHAYSGCSDDFLRGAGATFELLPKRLQHPTDSKVYQSLRLSAFYSLRMPDSIRRQVAGTNLSYTRNRLRLGATVVEYWTSDSVPLRANYYNGNYFRGTRQLSASINAQYMFRYVTLMAEAATSQNSTWGGALLTGARIRPAEDVRLLALYRYYSAHYDPVLAATFSETTRPNDEQGIYLGTEINRIRHWQLSGYTDFFFFSGPKYGIRTSSWGYDILAEADFTPSERFKMLMRGRTKQKGETRLHSLRLQCNNSWPQWSLRQQVDANLTNERTYGICALEQVEYRLPRIPMVFQARIEGFYLPDWKNRMYLYENDVLYSFSIPSLYGVGMRYYLNWRYRVCDKVSLYLRASDTWYFPAWVNQKSLASAHVPDVHFLLRLTL